MGREVPLVRPLETTPETHGPQGLGYAELPPPSRPLSDRHAVDLHPRRGPRPPGRDHARDTRALDEPGARGPARAATPGPAQGLRADGRGIRRVGQYDADDRVEHPLRPRRRQDRVPRLGGGHRGRPVDPATARARASTSPSGRASSPSTSSASRAEPGSTPDDSIALERGEDPMAPRAPWPPTRSSATSPTRCASTSSSTRSYDGFYGAFIHDPLAVAAALDRVAGHDRGALRRRRDPAARSRPG